jgi:sec-independent protein translocase protein TatB
MSSAELLLIFLVALVVFGPAKLPMLAQHLGKLVKRMEHLKQQLTRFWQTQLQEQQLQDNIKKAEKADALYQEKHHNKTEEDLS